MRRRRIIVEPYEVLLFTYQGRASLHRKGCAHLGRYTFIDEKGVHNRPRSKGVVTFDEVQREVDDLIERGIPVRRAECLK